jgi:hypothetical protein
LVSDLGGEGTSVLVEDGFFSDFPASVLDVVGAAFVSAGGCCPLTDLGASVAA